MMKRIGTILGLGILGVSLLLGSPAPGRSPLPEDEQDAVIVVLPVKLDVEGGELDPVTLLSVAPCLFDLADDA